MFVVKSLFVININILLVLLIICHICNTFHITILKNNDKLSRILMSDVTAASTINTGVATILKCEGLTKSFTGTPQFSDISLTLGKGQRIGLIGINGAGKSTLLKCLAKVDSPDSGIIETAANTNIIYVDQEPDWGNRKVYEALFIGESSRAIATRKYLSLTAPEASPSDEDFADALDRMESASAWDYQTDGFSIAEKLNIKEDKFYRDVDTLSGGERKRVALASALLLQPDVLLLDEPTNHLDADALEWLADFLKPSNRDRDMTMLLVTHDRYFLERVCSEIIELDRSQIYRYPGNYTRYLELKVSRLAAEDAETDRARTKLRRESEWMARQPKARQAKSKAREQQYYALVDASKGRSTDNKIQLSTPEEKENQKRLGGVVAEFRQAKYLMGDRVLLQDFSYDFRQRDRIGICGPNGVGKSTFLKILTGQLKLASGTIKLGETVRIGYYEQQGLILTPEQEKQPVLKFIQEAVEKSTNNNEKPKETTKMVMKKDENIGRRKALAGKEAQVTIEVQENYGLGTTAISERDAMSLLSKFQFSSKRWYDRVGQLSGGERRRLQLLQILALNPNFLILDEPSNDLDLSTLTALEEYLTDVFEGCLVIVSHDNFFVNHVCEHLFVFEGDGIVRDFQGSYTDYLDYRKDLIQSKKDESNISKLDSNVIPVVQTSKSNNKISNEEAKKPSNLSYNERKELNKLEKEINKLHQQIAELDDQILSLGNGSAGYSVLADLTNKVNELKYSLSLKEDRWLELSSSE